jgi:hypothetical protein
MTASTSNVAKIVLPLDSAEWHRASAETVWAERLYDDTFRLKNTPAYAYGLSFDDVVFAPIVEGRPTFDRLIESSGHSTYRLFLKNGYTSSSIEFEKLWEPLQELGCTFEGSPHLVAVDVPAEVNIYDAYRLFEKGEAADIWEFDEGKCAHVAEKQ